MLRLQKSSCLFLAGYLSFAPLFSAEKPWKNVTEASLVSTNGNTKTSTTSGKNTFNYNWSKSGLELIGGGLGSKSRGVNTAEKYFASEKVSYKLSDRNYSFEKFGWEKDRFAGIKNRYDSGLGLGRELIKTEINNLIFEIGGGFISEERFNQKKNAFASGRAYSKFIHKISETANFSQDAEYLSNFEDPDDFRVNTESAITAALSVHFSLKVSYTWKHVGVPPIGFVRNDTTTAVALIASY
jgi:putative salt-induced outer membrane protein